MKAQSENKLDYIARYMPNTFHGSLTYKYLLQCIEASDNICIPITYHKNICYSTKDVRSLKCLSKYLFDVFLPKKTGL